MNRSTHHFLYVLLVALFMVAGAVGPAHAQSTPPAGFEPVRVLMQDGWRASARHSAADDIVLVCPNYEVLDPSHPCSNSGHSQISRFDDFVLVCPVKEVLDPSHPCANRRAQIIESTADDFILVCPIKEVLDPKHPCAEGNQSKIPGDFVLTCPVKEVLEPGHPCAETSRSGVKSRS